MKFCKAFFNEEKAKEKAARMKTKFVQILKTNNIVFVQNYKDEARPWIKLIFEGSPKDLKKLLNNEKR